MADRLRCSPCFLPAGVLVFPTLSLCVGGCIMLVTHRAWQREGDKYGSMSMNTWLCHIRLQQLSCWNLPVFGFGEVSSQFGSPCGQELWAASGY
jgi:hypothetical protein